jgi:hypothetical protein
MKRGLIGTLNRLNIEHRTSNIERRILMTLRFIDFKTNQLQNTEPQDFEKLICFAQSFFKLIEFIIRCWTFNVRCSTFTSFFID